MPAFSAIVARGLIVSCQAGRGDPLHGALFMARMAIAAAKGGAVAIRADGPGDIRAIKESAGLPVIGSRKNPYASSPVYITPTFDDAAEACRAGADVVALDGTARRRPRGDDLGALIERIHAELAVAVLADVASVEDGIHAASLGADAVATTLSGYVEGDPGLAGPDLRLVGALAAAIAVPVIAEGRYQTPQQAAAAIGAGAWAVVVGTAITRPHVIAQGFAQAIAQRLA